MKYQDYQEAKSNCGAFLVYKIGRLALYGFLTYKIFTNYDLFKDRLFYLWGIRIFLILLAIGSLECVINIFHYIRQLGSEEPIAKDIFTFRPILGLLLLFCDGAKQNNSNKLTIEERERLRNALREVDRYQATDQTHKYWEKNKR